MDVPLWWPLHSLLPFYSPGKKSLQPAARLQAAAEAGQTGGSGKSLQPFLGVLYPLLWVSGFVRHFEASCLLSPGPRQILGFLGSNLPLFAGALGTYTGPRTPLVQPHSLVQVGRLRLRVDLQEVCGIIGRLVEMTGVTHVTRWTQDPGTHILHCTSMSSHTLCALTCASHTSTHRDSPQGDHRFRSGGSHRHKHMNSQRQTCPPTNAHTHTHMDLLSHAHSSVHTHSYIPTQAPMESHPCVRSHVCNLLHVPRIRANS